MAIVPRENLPGIFLIRAPSRNPGARSRDPREIDKVTDVIRSPRNAKAQLVMKLRTARGRRKENRFLLEGRKACTELLLSGVEPTFFLYEEGGVRAELAPLIEDLRVRGIPRYPVDRRLWRHITTTETPQGILAVVPRPAVQTRAVLEKAKAEMERGAPGHVVVFARLQDPGNLGSIIRTAQAFGFSGGIMTRGTVDPYGPKVVRSSATALLGFPLASTDTLGRLIPILKERGFCVLMAAARKGNPLAEVDAGPGKAIVVGNEGGGIPESDLSLADQVVRIPMPGPAESLNAGVAFGIIAYAIVMAQKG
jgi:TrmH family RNA methyltransferase